MANGFWQNLTPWKEQKGETFGTTLQNFWSQLGKPTPPATSGITFGGAGKAPPSQLPPTTTWGISSPWGVTSPTGVNPFAGAYAGGSGQTPIVNWNTPISTTSSEPLNVVSQGGYDFYYDPLKGWVALGETPTTTSTAMTEYQKAQIDLANRQFAAQQPQSDYSLQIAQMQQQQNQAELAWQQQQWNQQLAQEQKNYLANLAAEPHSWLEYAAAAGQAPVIQPWMLPLMPQDYGISAGQTIPGWSPTNMMGIPELTNPSAQYQARMGPTAQQQYYGYQQAKTGATPEQSQWNLWSMAPPSGNRGLTQVR